MTKLKVAILYGGPSNEHDVSLKSAQNVLSNIDKDLYEVIEILISKDGLFNINNQEYRTVEAITEIKKIADVVFPVLHGKFGEDGAIQELLERIGIPFVGSGSKASRIAINKNISNTVFAKNNLSIPQSEIVTKNNSAVSINFPIFIKPLDEGSSLGIHKCTSQEELDKVLGEAFTDHAEMLVQECVVGREFTCGVLEIDGVPTPLPLSEIILKDSKFFDYEAKYTPGACTEVTPAEIDDSLQEEIQDVVLQCHEILNCKSISRTDVIVSENGTIYVLETNTLPGMTKTSFIPAQAKAFGLPMTELITTLIKSAHT